MDRGPRVVFYFNGNVIGHKNRISLELIDDAAMLVDNADDQIEIFIQKRHHLGRAQALTKCGEAFDIREKDRRQLGLGHKLALVAENSIGDRPRHITAKCFLDEIPFAHLIQHVVEAGRQTADLIVGDHRRLDVQMALAVPLHCLVQHLHRARHAPLDEIERGSGDHYDQDEFEQEALCRGDAL